MPAPGSTASPPTACLDELRRRRDTVDVEGDADAPSTTTGPGDAAVAKADAVAVLSALGPETRATVLLVHGYGFDYEEAALALDVPVGTIASRLSRVRSGARQWRLSEVTADAA
jgi:RNA polymerase sigma-70 factor (ECF subfamily)